MTPVKPKIVYVQNSSYLAGAEKSLSRLLTSGLMRARFDLYLLVGKTGWLTRACEEAGVDFTVLPFPSSRSLGGRVWGNQRFVRAAGRIVRSLLAPSQPVIVHANDHPDSLLGLWLARHLECRSVLTMRTPGMSHRDFLKYRCAAHDELVSVGNDLFDKVTPWHAGGGLTLVHNGVRAKELLAAPSAAPVLDRVVVLGSLEPRKGWRDLVDALVKLEESGVGSFPKFVFVGHSHGLDARAELGLDRLRHCQTEFAGMREDYASFVREFPLAIHPSRSESFGMAALETVAAGIPLAAGATGLIPSFIPNRSFLFSPGSAQEIAIILQRLLALTPADIQREFDLPAASEAISASFTIDQTVKKIMSIYDSLLIRTIQPPR